jgi:hypothetical protein
MTFFYVVAELIDIFDGLYPPAEVYETFVI